MQGEGHCKSCGIEKQKQSSQFTPNQVESIINGINGNKLLNKSDYIGANVRNLRIICGSCGNEFIGSLSNIQLWSGKCHECSGKNKVYRKLETKEVIERVNKINNHDLLNPEDYTGTTNKNLKIKCGKCGNVFITAAPYDNFITCIVGHYRCSKFKRRAFFCFNISLVEFY